MSERAPSLPIRDPSLVEPFTAVRRKTASTVEATTLPIGERHDDLLPMLRAGFDALLRRMEYLQGQLHQATPPSSTPIETRLPLPPRRPRAELGLLLQATLRFLDQAQTVPLLKAPPTFEAAFAPYEPMFHTLFFRKYPYHLQADAKQEALLRRWLQWRRDMTLLEQAPAYVVQAALWGASPWGKKRAKVETRELPLPPHEHFLETHGEQPTRDPEWMLRVDRVVDVQRAIEQVRACIRQRDDAVNLESALQDVLAGRTRKAGRERAGLSIRTYRRSRNWVENALREALREYRPNPAPKQMDGIRQTTSLNGFAGAAF